MKKGLLILLLVLLCQGTFAAHRRGRRVANTSIDSSVELSFDISLVSSSLLLSDALEYDDYADAVKKTYDRFDGLLAEKDLRANKVFSEEGLVHYDLDEDARITLDKITIGIMVSEADRTLMVVPSDVKYLGITTREIR